MRKRYWVVSITVLWLTLVVSTIPATSAVYILQNVSSQWQMHNVTGSLWQGKAQKSQLLIDDKYFPLGQVIWRFNPLGLLLLKPCVDVSTQLNHQTLSTTACLSILSGQLEFQNSQFKFNAASIEPWASVNLNGDVHMLVELLVIRDGHFHEVDGVVTWRQAQFHNSHNWVELGDLQAHVIDDDTGGLRGRLNDTGQGPLVANVMVEAPQAGGLKISGDIIPQKTAQPAIHEILQIVGKSNNRGGYTVNWLDP